MVGVFIVGASTRQLWYYISSGEITMQYFFYNTTRLLLHNISSTIYTSENRGNILPIPKFTCIIRSQIDERGENYIIRHFAASGSGSEPCGSTRLPLGVQKGSCTTAQFLAFCLVLCISFSGRYIVRPSSIYGF